MVKKSLIEILTKGLKLSDIKFTNYFQAVNVLKYPKSK